ncbi:unnamed protein product, partial [Symbiodinium microadriaticum]
MDATSPDICRGISVHRALQHAPRKWARADFEGMHALSQKTAHFHEFWSHSWRTKKWLKYLNILFLNNSLPASVVGTVCALLAFFLSFTGLLPVWAGEETGYIWCTPAGIFGYYMALVLWRSQKLAFLDVACIHQTDSSLKAEALVSMGAFLKKSQSLLVLWDVSYVSRLWCVFEMAAFLHSKGPKAATCIQVCPVFVGPAFLAGHLGFSVLVFGFLWSQLPLIPWGGLILGGLALPCLGLLADMVLAHCRSIEMMQQQLRHFTFAQAKSSCCSEGHIDPTGAPMICDRKIISRCITAWFGGTEQFESVVRGQVLAVLVHQLSNHVFSYWRIVHVAAPSLWAILDVWCDNFGRGASSVPTPWEVFKMLYDIIVVYLLLLPSICSILLRLAYAARHLGEWKCTQVLLAVGLIAVGALLLSLYVVVDVVIRDVLLGGGENPLIALVTLPLMGLITCSL